jgi:hypothetical protein
MSSANRRNSRSVGGATPHSADQAGSRREWAALTARRPGAWSRPNGAAVDGRPPAWISQIRSVPGVEEATWLTWFGGYYQEPKNFVFALPVDTDTYFNLHKDEFIVSDEQMQAYQNMRTGALVNSALMKKFGWKVGDKVPLRSNTTLLLRS